MTGFPSVGALTGLAKTQGTRTHCARANLHNLLFRFLPRNALVVAFRPYQTGTRAGNNGWRNADVEEPCHIGHHRGYDLLAPEGGWGRIGV